MSYLKVKMKDKRNSGLLTTENISGADLIKDHGIKCTVPQRLTFIKTIIYF